MPYQPDDPAWMAGKKALAHIRRADRCSLSEAKKQLKAAISDRKIGARLPDAKSPRRLAIFPPWMEHSFLRGGGPGASPVTSPGSRQIPSPDLWRSAKIRAAGTVNFFGKASPWYAFKVLRAQVSQIWPDQPSLRSKAKPITHVIGEAINELWRNRIPEGLRPKERNNQIFEWLKRKGKSVPNSDAALARAVQRAIKSSTRSPD